MKQIAVWMGKGLLALVPILVTVYLLFWLVTTAEGMLAPAIRWIFGTEDYIPGSGLVVVAGLLIGAGILIDAYVGRWLLRAMEAVIDRLPLVKSVYGAVRDVMRFVVPEGEDTTRQAKKVVAWEPKPGAWMVGFVTGETILDAAAVDAEGRHVSVYFPMSYQIGGYTLMLAEDDLVELDLTVEEAMRSVVTAGVVRTDERGRS
jgi:uncharacterized membrane protein